MASEPKTRQRRRSSVHKHAKNASKLLDNLGKGISKGITAGVTKTKKFAIEKVVKVEPSKEPNEMILSLNKLVTIKKTIASLSDKTITNLYNEQVKESQHSLLLSEHLMSLKTSQYNSDDNKNNISDDLFKNFSNNVMGRKLFKLNTMTNEYLVKMEKELINPINRYKTKELTKVDKLLKEYESIKRDYDFAMHKYQKLLTAKQKHDEKHKNNDKNVSKKKEEKLIAKKEKETNKINASQLKKNEKFKLLDSHRTKIIDCINSLQIKQQINLLNCFDKFWKSYHIFSTRQAQIVSLKDGFDEKYESQKKFHLSDNDNDDDYKQNMNVNNNSSNDNDETDAFPENDITIFDLMDDNKNNSEIQELMRSTSLRVALTMNSDDNGGLSKELRYKNPIKLGSGAFATVYKANDLLNDDTEVAIKKISIGDGSNVLYLSSTKQEAENELKIMKSLNGHECIIKLIDDYYEETVYNDLYLNLVMDYIPSTLISQQDYYGETGDSIPHNLIQIYSFQLIKAINYMHIKKIAHRDVKPDNLLINTKTHILKLCDFGCSIKMKKRYIDIDVSFEMDEKYNDDLIEKNGKFENYVCSRYYRAPELILQSSYYDCQVDIWSCGCVIAEMFLGTVLFEGYNNESEQLEDIIKKLGTPTEDDIDAMNPDYIYKEDLLDDDEQGESWDMLFCAVMDMPKNAIDLLSKILVYNPSDRLTALKCLKCKYFEDLMDNEMCKELKLFEWTDLEIEYAKANGVNL